MKKIVAIALSAVMVMSMTACGGGEAKVDAKTVYQDAIKKNSELKSMDMSSDIGIKMTAEGESMEMSVKMNMKVDQLNTDKMVYAAETSTAADGQTMDAKIYYADGYYYMESQGQKIKYKMDLNQLMEQVNQSTDSNLDVEMFKELKVKKDGDNQILTFTADATKMNTYVQEMMGAMGAAGQGLEGMQMTVKSASGEYTINKDGYYTNMKLKMEVELSMDGQTAKMEMDMNAVINNPGQAVEITLPATDDYQEIEAPVASAQIAA